MEISVTNRQRRTGISTRHVRLLACRVLENESACFDEISINFLGARAVRSLNRRFTGRDEVTDTLAFEVAPDAARGLPSDAAGAVRLRPPAACGSGTW
jgi:ssRNA-specific RNase YbeY (16S rRNA maturation enzyme)